MRPITAFVLDLDGTLADSAPGIEWALKEALRTSAPSWAHESVDFHSMIGPPVRRILDRAFPQMDSDTKATVVARFRHLYDDVGWANTQLYDGVVPVLTAINRLGMHSYVVTNKPSQPTSRVLKTLGIDHLIRAYLSPDSHSPHFQNKTAATHALIREWQLDIEHALFLGDSMDDAVAAHDCGMRFGLARYGYGATKVLASVQPDFVLQSPWCILGIAGIRYGWGERHAS